MVASGLVLASEREEKEREREREERERERSYVYTYVWTQDGHTTIAGRNVYTGHAARNGLGGHASLRLAFEAGSHTWQTRDRT